MICTTLNKIKARAPCANGWKKLLAYLGKTQSDDEPLPLRTILDSNGLDDTLWCLRTLPQHNREWRLYAIWCARQVRHLMTDPRSLNALDVVERYANGPATDAEWITAEGAAEDEWGVLAAWAALAARGAAWDAAMAARNAAGHDEGNAARDAAHAAALAAGHDEGDAAHAAALAAWGVLAAGNDEGYAAGNAAMDVQETEFISMLNRMEQAS